MLTSKVQQRRAENGVLEAPGTIEVLWLQEPSKTGVCAVDR